MPQLSPGLTLSATLLLSLLLSACTYEHSRQQTTTLLRQSALISSYQVDRQAEWVLHPDVTICQALPMTASSEAGSRTQKARQQAVDEVLFRALSDLFAVVQIRVNLQDALLQAQGEQLGGCDLLVFAESLATVAEQGTRGQRQTPEDSLGHFIAHISLYEISSGRTLDIARVRGRAGAVTPVKRLPHSSIERGISEYVARLSNQFSTGEQQSRFIKPL